MKRFGAFVLLLANLACFVECSSLRLGDIRLPPHVKRSHVSNNGQINPPPSRMNRRDVLKQKDGSTNGQIDIPRPEEMNRRAFELREGGSTDKQIDIPPPDEMTRRAFELREGDVIENDIVVDKRLISVIQDSLRDNNKRGAIQGDIFRWPDTTDASGKRFIKVPYKLEDESLRYELNRAIAAFNDKTCIRFTTQSSEADYIRIYNGADCRSAIGRKQGVQDMSISVSKCNYMGVMIHEFMHALGFLHEQSRMDRDNFVTVNFGNMPEGMHAEYNQYDQLVNQDFDLRSLLLYGTFLGSINGQPTMYKNGDPSGTFKLGNTDFFSAKDLKRINGLYQCPQQSQTYADYKVEITTANTWFWEGGGTDEYVYVKIYNKDEQHSSFSSVGTGEGHNDFERGNHQVFWVAFEYVGAVSRCDVMLFERGKSGPDWKLEQVKITDPFTGTTSTFTPNIWIEPGETKTLE